MASERPARWYDGVTRYQWTVLAIASAGWIFDVFEGQLFNLTRVQMLSELLQVAPGAPEIKHLGDLLLGVFLLGGTAGGLWFGSLADRYGRRPVLIATILMYSVFSGLTCFAQTVWQVATLRFLVAMGVGGEWAVAAALVSELFPPRARAHAAGIFHASSVLGTWLAASAGLVVAAEWRYAYIVGIAPALLTLWVRSKVAEPEAWTSAETASRSDEAKHLGSFRELLTDRRWAPRAILGMLLAAVGLGTFWGVTVAGQDLAREMLVKGGLDASAAAERAKFAYGYIQTAGSGLGLLAFGPLAARFGRRPAFIAVQVGSLIVVPLTCYAPQTYGQLLVLLPIFGFFTLSMHAGFAVYFPELFPNHLRATGAGFCFNGGRILAASMLWFSGWLKARPGMELREAVTLLSLTFLAGLVVIALMPETKDQELPS